MTLEAFAFVVALFVVSVVVLKHAEMTRLRRSLVAYELRFPRGLDADLVRDFLGGVTGILPPWWRRWLVSPFVVFEVTATDLGIAHHILVPVSWAPVLENVLQSSVPGVRYESVAVPKLSVGDGVAYRLNTGRRPLRVDAHTLSSGLLTSLQPLRKSESIVVQWIVTPAGLVAPPRIAKQGEQPRLGRTRGNVADAEAAAALKLKQAHALLLGAPHVAVATASPQRARQLLRHVEVAWHGTHAPGVHLQRRLLRSDAVARTVMRRSAPIIVWPGTFNADELSGLLGWPVGVSSLPGLVLGGCRQIAASPLVSAHWHGRRRFDVPWGWASVGAGCSRSFATRPCCRTDWNGQEHLAREYGRSRSRSRSRFGAVGSEG